MGKPLMPIRRWDRHRKVQLPSGQWVEAWQLKVPALAMGKRPNSNISIEQFFTARNPPIGKTHIDQT